MLFGVLCHALLSFHRNSEEPLEYHGTSAAIVDLYRVRTAQCLVIADIRKPVKHMVEAMMLYNMAEYADEGDGDMGSWLLSGNTLRVALHQGYHRDPSQHPDVSVFDGEMRRRLWTSVNHHDLLFSVKIGLPKAIRYDECDTDPPRNINNDELYEEMTELPPARPLTEETPMSYFIIKSRILRAYGKVVEFLHVVQNQTYEQVMNLDKDLLEAWTEVPPYLLVRPLEEMREDPSSRIMERYLLQMFYHKAVCVLHRKHWNTLSLGSPETCALYSRKRCVTSSRSSFSLTQLLWFPMAAPKVEAISRTCKRVTFVRSFISAPEIASRPRSSYQRRRLFNMLIR